MGGVIGRVSCRNRGTGNGIQAQERECEDRRGDRLHLDGHRAHNRHSLTLPLTRPLIQWQLPSSPTVCCPQIVQSQ
jgi:hypothetical protein